MAECVTINGIVLTRAQVEQALKELNASKLIVGELVRSSVSGRYHTVVSQHGDHLYKIVPCDGTNSV